MKITLLFTILIVAVLVLPQVNSAQVPKQGLIAYYPFNGNTNDESGNGYNGTLVGAALTADRCGNANRAYDFDGVDDDISIPHDDAFNLTGSNSLSVSCWVNISTWTYGAGIWCKSAIGGVANYCLSLAEYDKLIVIANHYGGGLQENVYTNRTFTVDAMYHVVVVFSGKKVTIYVNGLLDKTHEFVQAITPNTGPFYIANDTDGSSEYLHGLVDDIYIYDRALTEVEIQALYLDQCTTTKLGDVNGNNLVNSTDALIVLSCEVGMDVSSFCPLKCGDVNGDGLVDSSDALIILSYDAGFTVPFSVGQVGCPTTVAPYKGCPI